MNILSGSILGGSILCSSIKRAITMMAVPIVLSLFAMPQIARADADPVFCGGTVFGALCANGVITRVPSFATFGNPQTPLSLGARTCVGACAGFLDSVSLSLRGGGVYSASDTVAGFNAGVLGSDISIPFANWLFPKAFVWTDKGPTGGGALAFFNSIGTLNGVFGVPFADMLIIGDPAPSTFDLLEALDGVLGGSGVLPAPIDISSDIDSGGNVNIPSADIPGTAFAPEPRLIPLLLAAMASGAFLLRQRRRAAGTITACSGPASIVDSKP
jgi:hypothetical protein